MLDYIYWILGYCEEELAQPTEKDVRQRHLLMRQVEDSNLRLKEVIDKQKKKVNF